MTVRIWLEREEIDSISVSNWLRFRSSSRLIKNDPIKIFGEGSGVVVDSGSALAVAISNEENAIRKRNLRQKLSHRLQKQTDNVITIVQALSDERGFGANIKSP